MELSGSDRQQRNYGRDYGEVGHCVATPWRCFPSAAITWAITSPLAQDWSRSDGRETAEDFLRELVSPGRKGKYLWPGYGENSRVLRWVFERCDGKVRAKETPIGRIPEVAISIPRTRYSGTLCRQVVERRC